MQTIAVEYAREHFSDLLNHGLPIRALREEGRRG